MSAVDAVRLIQSGVTIATYEGFTLHPDVEERFSETVKEGVDRWYLTVTH